MRQCSSILQHPLSAFKRRGLESRPAKAGGDKTLDDVAVDAARSSEAISPYNCMRSVEADEQACSLARQGRPCVLEAPAVVCYYCDKKGHMKRDCLKKKADDAKGNKKPNASAVLPTRLFGYFSVFRECHRVVLPGNVRFQTGEGLSRDWCSSDYGSIDHSEAKAMGKRCVRPSPCVLGYFSSNSGSIGAYSARNAVQLQHRRLIAATPMLTATRKAKERRQY